MSDAHGHGHQPTPPSPIERRAAALEELLTEKGLVPDGFIEDVIRLYENDIGPLNGAKVVAHAWVDPQYKARLLDDGTGAVGELGFGTPEGNLVAVENTPRVHNVVGCQLPDGFDIRVWDSSAEVRYLVVPERPAGTDDLSEEELAALVTRDSMIGVARL
jgi:nitrile hydratase